MTCEMNILEIDWRLFPALMQSIVADWAQSINYSYGGFGKNPAVGSCGRRN